MIFDRTENAGRYENILPGIEFAVKTAMEIPVSEISGDRPSLILSEKAKLNFCKFDTRPNEVFEAHRIFADVMMVREGAETVFFTDTDTLSVTKAYSAENDILFGETGNPCGRAVLSPGYFAVFMPEDAHAPANHPAGETTHVLKIVGKIRI